MRLRLFAVAAALLASSLAARADLTGDTLQVSYDYPSSTTQYDDLGTLVVDGSGSALGIDYSVTGSQFTFTDVDNMTSTPLPGLFSGFQFTDLTEDPDIASITLDPSSTFSGGVATFDANNLYFNFGGTSPVIGETAVFDVTFAPAATPEPSAFLLLGTGLLGLAVALRRRFA